MTLLDQQQRNGSSQTLHLLDMTRGAGAAAPLPSTLSYQERVHMRHTAAFDYSRIYNSSQGSTVCDRLTADAAVRSTLKSVHAAASARRQQADGASWRAAAVDSMTYSGAAGAGAADRTRAARRYRSGFVNNTTSNLHSQQHQQHSDDTQAAGHPASLTSQRPAAALQAAWKRSPIDCLAAARPAARTTNETLAVLGTYGSADVAFAARLGLHMSKH